ncbi:thioredoxin-like protein [Nemania sp. FL0031]|nr:thioredoxin-like protein [Nemania sp. FL0031]
MASPLQSLLKLFKRKKAPPLACYLTLDQDDSHVHTAACFVNVQPLAVAEIFQSQGCKACAPAMPTILEATQDPNLQVLTYDVTFFNHLGWEDTYASRRWDERLKNYVKKWGRNTLFTPMVVVNGVADGGSGGGTKEEIGGVIQSARDIAHVMDWHILLDANDTNVKIDSDKLETTRHDVLVIVYEDKTEVVKIGKGPNKGKKVPHKNVVRDIVKIGEWTGGNMIYDLPVSSAQMVPGTAAVAVVQEPLGGPIVATAKIA